MDLYSSPHITLSKVPVPNSFPFLHCLRINCWVRIDCSCSFCPTVAILDGLGVLLYLGYLGHLLFSLMALIGDHVY